MKPTLLLATVLLTAGVVLGASPRSQTTTQKQNGSSAVSAAASGMSDDDMRLEGEKRFRTNCGRCHQAPHKFKPRMMATIIRHMRVRSMITDEDMKYILRYMTQ